MASASSGADYAAAEEEILRRRSGAENLPLCDACEQGEHSLCSTVGCGCLICIAERFVVEKTGRPSTEQAPGDSSLKPEEIAQKDPYSASEPSSGGSKPEEPTPQSARRLGLACSTVRRGPAASRGKCVAQAPRQMGGAG